MKFLSRLLDWFLFTSLFLACCSTSLCIATEKYINHTLPYLLSPLHGLIFGGTLIVYNIHNLAKKNTQSDTVFIWAKHSRASKLLFLITGIALCGSSLFYLPIHLLISFGFLGVLALAYSLPLLPFKNKRHLRDTGLIKIAVLAVVWTSVTTILPIIYWQVPITLYPLEVVIRFLFLFSLCIAFDVRDMQIDLQKQIYTLPNLIGFKNSNRLINITLVLFVAASIVQYFRHPLVNQVVAAIVTAIITKWVISYTIKKPTDRAYLGLVDGVMFLYALLMLI